MFHMSMFVSSWCRNEPMFVFLGLNFVIHISFSYNSTSASGQNQVNHLKLISYFCVQTWFKVIPQFQFFLRHHMIQHESSCLFFNSTFLEKSIVSLLCVLCRPMLVYFFSFLFEANHVTVKKRISWDCYHFWFSFLPFLFKTKHYGWSRWRKTFLEQKNFMTKLIISIMHARETFFGEWSLLNPHLLPFVAVLTFFITRFLPRSKSSRS